MSKVPELNNGKRGLISKIHSCPECGVPVANIARRCQACGAEQPNCDAEAYNRKVELAKKADEQTTVQQAVEDASEAKQAAVDLPKPEGRRSPVKSVLAGLFQARAAR